MKNTNLIIEVIKGFDRPEQRVFNRGKENERTVYEQKGYMHTGAAFPVEIKLTFDELPQCLEVGQYQLLPSSFKAGRYGDIELDRFNMQFEKLSEQQLKQVS